MKVPSNLQWKLAAGFFVILALLAIIVLVMQAIVLRGASRPPSVYIRDEPYYELIGDTYFTNQIEKAQEQAPFKLVSVDKLLFERTYGREMAPPVITDEEVGSIFRPYEETATVRLEFLSRDGEVQMHIWQSNDQGQLNELRESLNQTQKKSLVEIEGHSVLYKDSHTWGDRDHFSMLCKAFLLHVGITGSERLKYDDSLAIMKNIIPDDC